MFELFSRAGSQNARGSSCPEGITEIPRCDQRTYEMGDIGRGWRIVVGKPLDRDSRAFRMSILRDALRWTRYSRLRTPPYPCATFHYGSRQAIFSIAEKPGASQRS
jgi:hypothetical protein